MPAVDPLRGLRVSYSALELHAACSLRYHLQVELGLPASDVVVAGAGAGGLPGARAFGERFHEEIQHVDWRAPRLEWDDARAQELFGVILAGELGKRLAAAVEVLTEWPFLVGVGGAVVEGVADVWALEADGTVLIVDWKTGTLHGPDDPGYALQQAIYALAGLRGGAERVETAWCHVAHEGAVASGSTARTTWNTWIGGYAGCWVGSRLRQCQRWITRHRCVAGVQGCGWGVPSDRRAGRPAGCAGG